MVEAVSILVIVIFIVVFIDRYYYTKRHSYYHSHTDHHIHIPLKKVPPEYYDSYKAYLKSPEWRAFRRLVLKRDKYRCVDCRVKGYNVDYNPTGQLLQVHHIHYDGIETMAFTIDQCVSVCHSCHKARHRR